MRLIVALLLVPSVALATWDATISAFDCDLPTTTGYLPGAEVTAECSYTVALNAGAGIRFKPLGINSRIRLDAYAMGPLGPTALEDSRVLSTQFSSAIGLATGPWDVEKTLTLNGQDALTGEDLGPWLATQYAAGRRLVLRLVLDEDDNITEGAGEFNNETSFNLATPLTLVPLTGQVSFGPVKLTLDAGAAKDGTAACPNEPFQLKGNSTGTWTPASNGKFDDVKVELGNLCMAADSVTADGVSLKARTATATVSGVTGTMAGLSATFDVTLSRKGIEVTTGSLRLPRGHAFHEESPLMIPVIAGSRDMPLTSFHFRRRAGDMARLQAERAGGYLHSEQLPFYLRIKTVQASAAGVQGIHDGPRYAGARPFMPDDPRSPKLLGIPEVASNDLRFANPAVIQPEKDFRIMARGLRTSVLFSLGEGYTHFPNARLVWQPAQVEVRAGRLATQEIPRDLAYHFRQAADCPTCPVASTADPTWMVTPTGKAGLGSDGAVLSRVEDLTSPAWGPSDGTSHVFERGGDESHTGVMMIPGFVVQGTEGTGAPGVASYLLGTREATDSDGVLRPDAHHDLDSPDSRAGNFFMAGVTVGPERYDDGNAPAVGLGESLAGDTEAIVRLGGLSQPGGCDGAPCAFTSSLATKYVARKGGVTGVFNAEEAGLPQPEVYGYPLPITRFGFRHVLNGIDPLTGIDGSISVPAPGDFTVAFDSLGLQCTGALTRGVVPECPEDDPEGPNCGEVMGAWHMAMTPLTLGFVNAGGDSLCEPGDRDLEVGKSLDVLALNDPLGLTALWSPTGEPSNARVTGATDHVLDEAMDGKSPGFPLAFHAAPRLEWMADATAPTGFTGWLAMTADFAAPFWDALVGDVRLMNQPAGDAIEKAPTLVRAPGADWFTDTAPCTTTDCALTARYTWGNSGFSLDLQTYYDTSGLGVAGEGARFAGLIEEHSLAIMNANAAIDFIEPSATRVSFGASADLAVLDDLSLDVTIDIDDPASIAATDALLATFGIDGAPIGSIVEDVRAETDALLDLLGGANLEVQVRATLEATFAAAVEALPNLPLGEDGFDFVVEAIQTVRGLPALFAASVSLALEEQVVELTGALTADIDLLAVGFYRDFALVFSTGEVAPCTIDDLLVHNGVTGVDEQVSVICDRTRDALDELLRVVATVRAALIGARDAVASVRLVVDTTYTLALDQVASASVAIDDLVATLDTDGSVTGLLTGDMAKNAVLAVLYVTLGPKVMEVVEALEAVKLVSNLKKLGSIIPVPATALETEQDLVDDAAALAADIDAAISSYETTISLGDYSDALDGATGYLEGVGFTLNDVRNDLEGYGFPDTLAEDITANLDTLDDELASAAELLRAVEGELLALKGAVDCAYDADCLGTEFQLMAEATIQAQLNARLSAAAEGTLTFVTPAVDPCPRAGESSPCDVSFANPLVDLLRGSIDQAIADVALTVETKLPALDRLPDLTRGEELLGTVVDLVLASSALETVLLDFQAHFDLPIERATALVTGLFDQVGAVLEDVAASLDDAVDGLLDDAVDTVRDIGGDLPIEAARIDGNAIISGDELSSLHVGAEWTMSGQTDDDTRTFSAALDVTSWATNGKGDACAASESEAMLDAVISTKDLPLRIGPAEVTIEDLFLGFTLKSTGDNFPNIVGLFGGIYTSGGLDFEQFRIYDIGFEAGVGAYETYVGARAAASFDSIQLSLGFLVGRTCDLSVLTNLDPQVAEFLGTDSFSGLYARGSASFPVISGGCLLNLSLTADVGTWVLVDSGTVGGLVGGGAYGKLGCIGALRGQATAFAQVSQGKVKFTGEGFGIAGAGIDCDPETWTTIAKSRDDKDCGTGDAKLSITYDKGKWKVPSPNVSAVH